MLETNRGALTVRAAAGLALLAGAAGCGVDTKPGAGADEGRIAEQRAALAVSFSVVTPTGDPKATLLSASDSLTVDDRVTLGTASALEITAAFGAPPTTTAIAAGVQAHSNLTSRGPITMGSNATVFGFARSGSTISKQLGAHANGGEVQNATITSVPGTGRRRSPSSWSSAWMSCATRPRRPPSCATPR